jgi:integrase
MANFTQRENDKWQAKIRRKGWPDQSKSFQTLEAAQQWARAVEREMDIGAFINRNDAEKTTFNDAASRYAKDVIPKMRGAKSDLSRINRLTETFGKYSLASINAAMLSSYRDDRLKVVAAQTVTHELNMLSRIFKACAMDWGIALPQGIPTALVRKPKIDAARDRRLETGEWELLRNSLLQCKSKVPLAVVEFSLETAARRSEVLSLTWGDVDLKSCTARLRGIDGGITKNGATYRDVPLSSKAVAVLSAQTRSISPKAKVFKTTEDALKQSYERAVERGRKTHVQSMLHLALTESGLNHATADAEIRAVVYHKKRPAESTMKLLASIQANDNMMLDLHFHDLRHEATSRLAEMLQMHELMKVTGHKSSAMLARYYHPRASDLAQKLG